VNIGVLVLAAGSSRRFGDDKRLAELPGGEPLLYATLSKIRQTGLPLMVCLGPGDSALTSELRGRGIDCCVCNRAPEGMGATLAEGIGHVQEWDGSLVALGDMPFVKPETYRSLAKALQADNICVPESGGRPGNPVGFGRRFYPELGRLSGDQGGKRIVRQHADRVTRVQVLDDGIHRDVDVPADLDPEFAVGD
jgi:molybdenum cofactor cytidylyltransferase